MTTVAVLMGGWSPEREVSLVSGKACAEGLREGGHRVIEYDVKRDLRALIEFLRPSEVKTWRAIGLSMAMAEGSTPEWV